MDLLSPLLFTWARRIGLQDADAADLVQDTFLIINDKLSQFEHRPDRGGFRGWLRTILLNRWREQTRRWNLPLAGGLDVNHLPEPSASQHEEAEYRMYLIKRCLMMLQGEFPEAMLRAFHQHVLQGQPPEEVAAALQISVNSVYLAKSRICRRLREELDGILE